MRRALTAFGSGWRGLVPIDPVLLRRSEKEAVFCYGESANPRRLKQLRKVIAKEDVYLDMRDKALRNLDSAMEYSKRTGFDASLINTDIPRDQVRATIRHERIHAFHYRNAQDPALKAQAQSARGMLPDQWVSRIEDSYKGASKLEMSSEFLAYGNETNTRFFPLMKSAGYRLPQTAAVDVKRVMRAGEHVHETSSLRRIFSRVLSSVRMPRGL